VIQQLSCLQDFYGHRRLTLTFDPVTLTILSLSRGPGNTSIHSRDITDAQTDARTDAQTDIRPENLIT